MNEPKYNTNWLKIGDLHIKRIAPDQYVTNRKIIDAEFDAIKARYKRWDRMLQTSNETTTKASDRRE